MSYRYLTYCQLSDDLSVLRLAKCFAIHLHYLKAILVGIDLTTIL